MGKLFPLAVGAGFVSLLLTISVASGSMLGLPLAYLAPLPIFLIGLSLGYTAAGIAALTGGITLAFAMSPAVGGIYFASTGLAPIVLCRQALQWRENHTSNRVWYPVGWLLVWLSGLTAAFFIAALLYFAGADGGLSGALESQLLTSAQELDQMATGENAEFFKSAAESLRKSAADGAKVLPGTLALSWMTYIMLNGILAQALIARSGRNFRPSPKYGDMSLPRSLSYVTTVALICSFAPGGLGFAAGTLAAIVIWPYFILGLIVVHVISRRLSLRFMLLAAFYLILLRFGWPAALVAGLGLMDQWMGLRQRYSDPNSGQEKE